jgi:gamma-tubulin complex component 2
VNIITDAYAFASKALLELIMEDNDLMGHLLSVKRYFLLQQGDFIVQFMDACEGELTNNVDEVIPMRLENLLELTLRLSSAKHDKYQDDLFTTLLPFDICTQMAKIIKSDDDIDGDLEDTSTLKGIECFTFGYNVHWPLSIVLNQMTISKYQLIFRQLFFCKHVENYLCRVWIANKNAKKFDHSTSELYRAAFTLRQRMMNAIQNLEYYMMIEVIEPVWHVFMQQMAKAKNIDDVLGFHEDFLDHCLKNCMLTYPELLKRIISVCKSCIGFCEFIEVSQRFPVSTLKLLLYNFGVTMQKLFSLQHIHFVYCFLSGHIQDAQRHFIDAELSSMLSQNYIDDESSDQQVRQTAFGFCSFNLTFHAWHCLMLHYFAQSVHWIN